MGFAKPSEAPEQSGWSLEDEENIGSLFVIEPKEEKEVETKDYGKKTVVVASVTEIDRENPSKSVTHDDVYIFAGWVKGSVRHLIEDGGMALGELAQDADKGQGKNAAWVLEDYDKEDEEAATAWLNARSQGALGGGKKKKGKK